MSQPFGQQAYLLCTGVLQTFNLTWCCALTDATMLAIAKYCTRLLTEKIFREGPPVIRSPPQISNQSPPMHSNATNLLCINLCFRLTLVELFWKPQCHHFSCRGWGKRGGWVGPFTPKITGKKPPFEALSASSAGATLRYLDLRGLAAAPPYGDGKSVTRG